MTTAVCLRTNDPAKELSLASFRLAGSGDFLVADLHVRSRGFSCDHPFYFDRFHAEQMLAALEAMDRGAVTRAILKQECEDDHLTLENDHLGHVIVTGEMVELGWGNRLAFTIETDQTVLRPFIDDFRQALPAAD